MEMEDQKIGTYFLNILIRMRNSNFRFWLCNIYGPANHEFSEDFIKELSDFCVSESLPALLGGDFNLIRHHEDRNKGQGVPRLMNLFNNFIGSFLFREIYVSGMKFTWSNKQQNPTLIKLDRILASTDWDSQYPKCFAWTKARVGSDHCPMILDLGVQGATRPKYFFFQDQWFLQENFTKMVCDRWDFDRTKGGATVYSLDRWHGCLQSLRQFLRGWNLKLIGDQRKAKQVLVNRIEEIDCLTELRLLDIHEWEERLSLENQLDKIHLLEEIHWRQRARKNWVLKGDTNTHFFHQYANGRRRKSSIFSLEANGEEICGQKRITQHIVDFYKELFGHSSTVNIKLGENFWPTSFRVNAEEQSELIKHFEEDEIRKVIMEMKTGSAPGPNGFGASFFKKF
jgi:hypothetical protein